MNPQTTYDYIIVGGGSAGCVLANRLTADSSKRVLVIEAGHRSSKLDLPVRVPAAFIFLFGKPFYDWCFKSEPEPGLHGRRIEHYRGKLMGGSSSINGLFYQRGNPMSFDQWAQAPGMEDWDYAHCLPYFKKLEDYRGPESDHRGKGGPLPVEQAPANRPIFKALFDAAKQAGYEVVSDVNAHRQEGFGAFDRNIRGGERWSAARAYVDPVRKRPNLEVMTNRLVRKVVFEGKKAVGVEIGKNRGGESTIVHGQEVILCGGAFNSPQLLQLSGVGNAAELSALNIPVVHDLPGVGENLQDHLEAFMMYEAKKPVSIQPYMRPWRFPEIGLKWLFGRKGVGASNHFEAGGFVRTHERAPMPNMMFTMLPVGVRNDGSPAKVPHAYQINIGPQTPTSKGHVKLKSADPRDAPALTFNYLSTEEDRSEWIEGVRTVRELLSQKAFLEIDGGQLSPGPNVRTDEEILDWVATDAETSYHPCGSCKMGTEDDAVVDPNSFRVHGLDGIRVVDASIMPIIPNANLFAPVMMIAEKAADAILGNKPLAPEHVPYYRHEGARSS
ncbi:choline dehydrogenase [Arthrobacter sp. Alg241-R88]|uniref:choline dehydrogenase n=1 Tax=Arthrobacter sp. Alg241-R88 TaxID=2305984 RepID=UPI0013D128FB|nr:choline dehydrogenase [Arthrobacter sp. Alg241-R88]